MAGVEPPRDGQLGDGTTTERWSPTLVFGASPPWKQIEGGVYGDSSVFTCGLTTGGRGSNSGNEVPAGQRRRERHHANPWTRRPITNIGVTHRQLTAGEEATACAVSTSKCGVLLGRGRLRDKAGMAGNFYPTHGRSRADFAFRQVTAGAVHTCGTTTGNKAYCWGQGHDQNSGTETRPIALLP